MFRVSFFVDDRKLGPALHALVGIAHGQPEVAPVVNAKLNGHTVVAKSHGSTMNRFAEELQALKGTVIKASNVRELMKPLGLTDKSYSYVLKKALEAKLLKRSGKGEGILTRYEVL